MGSCRGNCGDDSCDFCDFCDAHVCQYRDCDRGRPTAYGNSCGKCHRAYDLAAGIVADSGGNPDDFKNDPMWKKLRQLASALDN